MIPVNRMTNNKQVFKWKSFFFLEHVTEHSWRVYLPAIISGVLIGTTYIPFPAWAIGFCFIPLWWGAHQALKLNHSLKSIFIQGWITQFILSLIGFNWIFYAAYEFGHLHWTLCLLALLLFASLIHIYIPLALVIACHFARQFNWSTSRTVLLIALSHIILERFWPSIFEWNLGYTLLWMKWPISQLASYVGFWGLSALIFIFQALILISLIRKRIFLILPLILSVYGLNQLGLIKQNHVRSSFDSELNALVVQANISNEEKLQSEKGASFQSYVINTYFKTTEDYLRSHKSVKPDLIIWPETALPVALDHYYSYSSAQKAIRQKAYEWNTAIVTGAYSQDRFKKDHLNQPAIRNSIFFIHPNELDFAPPYYKTDLLVFGEYMPLGQQFPFLYSILPFVGNYERGPGPSPKILNLPKNRQTILGPQLCYESLNPGFSRGLSLNQAEVFFNLTNDSWFGWWAEPYQHLLMTLARGIENERPLIRSTNTGITSVMLADGTELERSKSDTVWAHNYRIQYQKNPSPSFYTKWGYLDIVIWILLFTLQIAGAYYVHHKKS